MADEQKQKSKKDAAADVAAPAKKTAAAKVPAAAKQSASPKRGTRFMKKNEAVHGWWVVDLKDQVLGRAATKVASALRGKLKVTYDPHVDTGDFVIVINAEQVRLTGAKHKDKKYYTYSGYPGGIREFTAGKMLEGQNPGKVFELAVRRMLPKGPLGRRMFTKLKVYAGAAHPHGAQAPKAMSLS